MVESNTWHSDVPNDADFTLKKKSDLLSIASQSQFRNEGLALMRVLGDEGFGHKNSWMGVPIIRLPEDMILQQELIWIEKPDLIIEVGVARGGGLLYNASLQEAFGIKPNVVGIDNKVFEHTWKAIESSRYASAINILEGDSVSEDARAQVARFTKLSEKTLLVLDSDHSSKHVLSELEQFVPLLPVGSVIIVCDTLIDELPPGTYRDRSWGDGKGHLDAIQKYRLNTDSGTP
jgi:cephalosporin hydroxylase